MSDDGFGWPARVATLPEKDRWVADMPERPLTGVELAVRDGIAARIRVSGREFPGANELAWVAMEALRRYREGR